MKIPILFAAAVLTTCAAAQSNGVKCTDPDSHYPTRTFCEVTVSGETTYTIQTCADDGCSIEQVSQSFYNRVLDSLVKQEADRVSRQIVPAPTTLGACWWETNTKAHNKCLLEVAKRERKAAEKAAKKK